MRIIPWPWPLLLLALSAAAHAELCSPTPEQWYKGKGPLVITQPKLLIATHLSKEFNDDQKTMDAVKIAIDLLRPTHETVFVHTGSFKSYFYPMCTPDWFYKAMAGDISIDLEAVNDITLMGGYYSLCLHNTTYGVEQGIKHLKTPKSMKITYVIDGVFESMMGLSDNEQIMPGVADEVVSDMGNTFNFDDLIQAFTNSEDAEAKIENLLGWIHEDGGIPKTYAIQAHLRNHYWPSQKDWIEWTIQPAKPGAPVIDIYYEQAKDL
jgi:hypothetical protein